MIKGRLKSLGYYLLIHIGVALLCIENTYIYFIFSWPTLILPQLMPRCRAESSQSDEGKGSRERYSWGVQRGLRPRNIAINEDCELKNGWILNLAIVYITTRRKVGVTTDSQRDRSRCEDDLKIAGETDLHSLIIPSLEP